MAIKTALTGLSHARLTFLALVMSALSACSDLNGTIPEQSTGNISDDQVSLSLFPEAYAMRALDLDLIYALVTVNGNQQRFNQSEDITFTIEVTNGVTLAISVEWFEQGTGINGQDLLLGTFSGSQVINVGINIQIDNDDYVTSGTQGGIFDVDNDGFSNLDERVNDGDPADPTVTPGNPANVRIKRIAAADAPVIDGLYENAWDNARFDDVQGRRLAIDNLMINQGALRPDGQDDGGPEMRWFAMHDDTYLYLFVLGKDVGISPAVRDSDVSAWHDDAVNIFIDGNNSKGQSYDGADDRHIVIPLLHTAGATNGNNSSNADSFVAGSNSASIPAFTFSACLCSTGQHTWEIRIPMAEFGISVDSAFGFDVQIDVDHDSDARDARWGWFHPSRDGSDVDNSWTNPSFLGIAIAPSS